MTGKYINSEPTFAHTLMVLKKNVVCLIISHFQHCLEQLVYLTVVPLLTDTCLLR